MGWNVECDVLLLGLNERWLFFLFRKSENAKSAPSSTRMWGICPKKRNLRSRLHCFTPTEWVPRGAHSVAVKQMWIFKISGEVSNEAVCRHGVTLKSRFLNPLWCLWTYSPPFTSKSKRRKGETKKQSGANKKGASVTNVQKQTFSGR